MADPRRQHGQPGRIGSMLVGVGCLGVLGLTFGAGFYTGRHWTRASTASSVSEVVSAQTGAPQARRGASAGPATPALTFYEELTAPLATTPPPAKAAPAEPRRAVENANPGAPRPGERTARNDAPGAEARARRSESAGTEVAARRSESADSGPRFTVQVAAYSARASAEALRNTISASGHPAYIVESEGPPGAPRYRVRVGSYPSREAAIAAASRLPVPGSRYVTTR